MITIISIFEILGALKGMLKIGTVLARIVGLKISFLTTKMKSRVSRNDVMSICRSLIMMISSSLILSYKLGLALKINLDRLNPCHK